MRTLAAIALLVLAAGCSSVDRPAPVVPVPDQPSGSSTNNDDPPFDLVLMLCECQTATDIYFCYWVEADAGPYGPGPWGNSPIRYHDGSAPKGSFETNIMVEASGGRVISAHGIDRWSDGYGRVHTIATLQEQLAFNAFLRTAPNSGSVAPVLLTGILDRPTLLIPWQKLSWRAMAVQAEIDNASQECATALESGGAEPAVVTTWKELEGNADDALARLHDRLMQIPLVKTITDGSTVFDDDLSGEKLKALKSKPELRQYFQTHALFGLPQVWDADDDNFVEDSPGDSKRVSYPPGSDEALAGDASDDFRPRPQTKEERDAALEAAFGFHYFMDSKSSHSDEAEVKEYADPGMITPDMAKAVADAETEAEEALAKAKAYEEIFDAWFIAQPQKLPEKRPDDR